MLNQKLTTRAANASADTVGMMLRNGYLRIYGGDQPLTADSNATDQPLLAELRFSPAGFQPASGGVAEAWPLTPEKRAKATGKATWFRVLSSGGLDVADSLFDGSVGETHEYNLTLDNANIQAGEEVIVTAFQYRQHKARAG